MDNLARDAMLAKQAGMSYGQWKATQTVVVKPKGIPDGWIPCEYCGKHFKPKTRVHKFCEIGCREQANQGKYRKDRTEYMSRYRAEKKKQEK